MLDDELDHKETLKVADFCVANNLVFKKAVTVTKSENPILSPVKFVLQ
jgi:hypothetical protein